MANLDAAILITAIGVIIGAIGVIATLIFAILELKHLNAERKTEMLLKLVPYFGLSLKELNEASNIIYSNKFSNYDDFSEKYGDLIESNSSVPMAFKNILGLMEGIGILYFHQLINRELLSEFYCSYTIEIWNIMKPLVIEYRKRTKIPTLFEDFQYMAEDMHKYRNKKKSILDQNKFEKN
jgi:hypothetical protein